MKRLVSIPLGMSLGLAFLASGAVSAQATNVELLDVRIGDRCANGEDLGYDRMVLDVRGRIKDVTATLDNNDLAVTSNVPVEKDDFADVNAELSNPEWVFSYVEAAGTTLTLTLTERVSSEEPVFIVSVLKGAYPEGGANLSRLVIDVYEDEPDTCSSLG